MTQEFKPGTKVHVEFDAVIEAPDKYDFIEADGKHSHGLFHGSDYGYGFLKVRDTANGLYHYVWTSPSYGDDLVTVVHKTDWEKYDGAQVGDIWEANGHEYFAYVAAWGFSVTLFPVDGVSSAAYYSSGQHGEFGELNPRLVRRRGEEI